MEEANQKEERRSAQRFAVGWQVAVKLIEATDPGSCETGTLKNLSSLGAFLNLSRIFAPGEKFELQVKVPFRSDNWMTYRAQVVRIELTRMPAGVAVKFDSARPLFLQR